MLYDFAVGRTNPETFPLAEFQRAAQRAIERDHALYTAYPGELGHDNGRDCLLRVSWQFGPGVDDFGQFVGVRFGVL